MKKFFGIMLCIAICLMSFSNTSHASNDFSFESQTGAGSDTYVDIVITNGTPVAYPQGIAGAQTITSTKTAYARDANQNILWYVSITATFIYDGTTAQCVTCSHGAGSNANSWSIKTSSSSFSGNSATATATATHTSPLGISQDYTMSVTIYCSPAGVIS